MCRCFYPKQNRIIIALQWDRVWHDIRLCDKACALGYVFVIRNKSQTKKWSVVKFNMDVDDRSYTLDSFWELESAIIFAKNINNIKV